MRINQIIDYFMIVALIFVSGNIAFRQKELLFVVVGLSFILFIYRKIKFDLPFFYFLLVLLIIVILQGLKFNFFPIATYMGLFARILGTYFLLKSIDDFAKKFINVMYYFAIISLIFLFFVYFVPGVGEFLKSKFTLVTVQDIRHSLFGVYTLIDGLEFKNAGPFWEMGAFGGYLMITLILSYLRDQILLNKINILLIITILSTQSSTAYIALFSFMFFIFFNKTKDLLLKILVVSAILSISYIAYMNLEFLGEKIETQLQEAKDVMDLPSLEGESTDRFVTMLKDWRDFKGHELIGRGTHASTRYSPSMYDIKTDTETRTVGTTDIIVRYGLPFFILLIFLMYKSFSSYSKSFSKDGEYMGASIVFIILLLLTSETYFLNPIFWMVIMLQYVYIADEDEPNEQINENKFYNLNK
jgi:hypothetical protein